MTIEDIIKADENGERFTVEGYGGVAFYFHSIEVETRYYEDEDMEYEHQTGMVRMVMVGDDYKHSIDPDDVEIIPEDAYCHECGQIGCKANG